MTTWADADNGADQVYTRVGGASIWDDGESVWDLEGNASVSIWDITPWDEAAGTSTTWVDA